MHAKLSTKRYSKKCFTLLLFSTHLTPLTTEAAINYSSIQSLYHRHSIYFFILTHSWRSSRFALLFANLHCSKFLIFSLFPFIRQLFLLFIVGRLDLAFQMWRQRHVFMSHTQKNHLHFSNYFNVCFTICSSPKKNFVQITWLVCAHFGFISRRCYCWQRIYSNIVKKNEWKTIVLSCL